MTIASAYSVLRDAQDEELAAKAIIIGFSKAFGPGVWREGHPMDVWKVDRLRRARGRIRDAKLNLDYVMRHEPVAGMA
jgi:hypothetical protein